MKRIQQEIYINLDDSGKLTPNEKITVYAGIVFLNKKSKDKFITQYRSIINSVKCGYCKSIKTHCKKNCPEIKSSNISPKDKRRMTNYIKNHYTVACIIKNHGIYEHIINNKASKGRYLDYALRMFIKKIIISLISKGDINPNLPVRLILNLDEQATKSNGYYNLREGLMEELVHGIYNFNYNTKHEPVLFSDFQVTLSYLKSDKSIVVQAADMIAGTVRSGAIKKYGDDSRLLEVLSFLEVSLFLP